MTHELSSQQRQSVRIMVCGLISADIIFQVQDMPRHAEKYRANDVRFSLGGGGAIAAVALKNLGALVHLAGRLGDDAFAYLVNNELITRSIECSRVARITDSKSPLSSIFIDTHAERQIVNYRSTDKKSIDLVDLMGLENLSEATALDAVLVDTRWENAALHLLHYARTQRIPAVVDAESPVSHECMAMATHVAFSRQGLQEYANTDAIEIGLRTAYAQFGNWICVTDGAKGVFYLDNEHIAHVPSFPIKPIDTLGAGDVWHAAFTLQLAMGVVEHQAIVFANAAAALKCTSTAGIDGAPDYSTTTSLVRQHLPA